MFLLTCAAALAFFALFFGMMHLLDPPMPDRPSVADIAARLAGECHPSPRGPMSIEAAHAMLQERRDCDLESCGEKWTAYWFLVDAGRLRPGRQVVR